MIRRPPRSTRTATLFPYTTLFRSGYRIPAALAGRLPFYYGWVILACVCCAGFSRQGPAVATLSVFVEPMTAEFGWSRTALSGAVSLGGILAAFASPLIGPQLDRPGAKDRESGG